MNTTSNEYLPTESTDSHPKKIFRLTPAEDDLTAVILTARLNVIETTELSLGSRLLFVLLLDLSLRRSVNLRPGVVAISVTKLSDRLGKSRRTISRWLTELKQRELIWASGLFLPNAWAINTYHLSAIDPKGTHQAKTTPEGMWGNGGLRGVAPPPCHQWHAGPKEAESAQVVEMSTPTSRGCPLSVANGVHGQWTPVSTGSSHPCPLPVANGVHGDRTPVSSGSSHPLPAPVDTDGTPKKAEDVENRASEESSLSVQRSSTLKQGLEKRAENIFLLDVQVMCDRWRKGHGRVELTDSGGWWRMGFRTDRDLMRRVLAETHRAVKESQVKTTPGQYAADLWKRWGGKIASPARKGRMKAEPAAEMAERAGEL